MAEQTDHPFNDTFEFHLSLWRKSLQDNLDILEPEDYEYIMTYMSIAHINAVKDCMDRMVKKLTDSKDLPETQRRIREILSTENREELP